MTIDFWLILLAVCAYGLLHSVLASLQVKTITSEWLGASTQRWYRLAFNFIAVVTLLPILLLPVLFTSRDIYTIPFPWLMISTAIQILAILILVVGLRQTGIASFLGLSQFFMPGDISPPRLVTGGLYRFVRHPLYSAGLMFIWMIPIMTWNLLAVIIGLTIYILIGAQFEERKMVREFGNEYEEYRRRTPMLVPGLHLPSFQRKS